MKIIVDADACPVTKLTESIAKEYRLPCTLVIDTSHIMQSDYSTVITVDKGADSADLKIVSLVGRGDVVVTQDYGLAALCLARGAVALNQNGMVYSDDNIDALLYSRAAAAKIRRAGGRLKGPKKRDSAQNTAFEQSLRNILKKGDA